MSEAAAPGASLPTLEEAKGWVGFELDEVGSGHVGRVHALFVDAEGGQPAWLIAALGRRRPKLVGVPLRDCAAAAGRAWTAHSAEALRTAPAVDPTRPLLREHELTICAHYGIGEGMGRAAEVADRPEGAVTSQPA
ncbi:MAG TPA: hypothetical protein VFP23_03870 [Solirubrobacterales bacterium]|nr:hypothetical protein [Solirubrobacterales bacterium]